MTKQERTIVKRTFSVIALIGLVIVLFSCSKEQKAQSCECYETYENLEQVIVQGMPQNTWVFDYDTPLQDEPCSNASDWVYMSNGTKRYKKTCQ